MTETDGTRSVRYLRRALSSEWRAIGGLGRVALLGILAAAILTIALGFSITNSARTHLLNARADLVAAEVATLGDGAADPSPGSFEFSTFAAAAAEELLGGETERIKIWSPDGRIAYSDDPALTGSRFALSAPALAALGGDVATEISDLDDPAHEADQDAGQLIEIYVPVVHNGDVVTVVEVEQRLDSLNEALGRIQRNVWLSIAFGVAVLATFLLALGLALARRANRRRQSAERVLGAAFRAQEEERRRIVGAMHDDIGQPLYRLLYGLEGSRAKLRDDTAVAEELERLEDLVRSVDGTLRSELQHLHHGFAADAGLVAALKDLATTTAAESSLNVHAAPTAEPTGLSEVQRTALFRAAQEATINVRKHADAKNLWFEVEQAHNKVVLVVADDGRGSRGEPGLGLTTTRERIEALGGGITLSKRASGGSVFTAWLPTEDWS
ncbi:MAG TPA: ATP-binding protein [Acidimicrobiia bacterium]|jgi:two-component system sensor histidine kinase UhpB|nr:ATP-binding protein [Acidimicrobiia bacterium]